MKLYAFLAIAPVVVFGCLDPKSNACASAVRSQPAASAFCATFTKSVVTATTALPAWATNCKNKPSELSKECTCAYTAGGPAPTSQPPVVTTLVTSTKVSVTSTKVSATPDPTPTQGGNCGAAPVDALVGYGAGTTGGGSGAGVTVTTCSSLLSAIANAGVIRISGLLSGCGIYDVKSSTTIIGVGANSGMTGGGLRLKSVTNVILRNLKLHVPPKSGDVIALDKSTKVWIDHCDLSSIGIVGGKDDYDGLLDITHASDFVTVSWTKFHDHWKGSLIGHSDSNSGEDTGKLKVTHHHNHFSNVNSRLPSLRFGTGHVYSSCFENCPTSGINVRMGANALVESSYFLNVPLAITTALDSDQEGLARSVNNVFVSSTTDITQNSNYSPPYSYVTDPASCICDLVKAKAGTGIVA